MNTEMKEILKDREGWKRIIKILFKVLVATLIVGVISLGILDFLGASSLIGALVTIWLIMSAVLLFYEKLKAGE